MPLLCKVCNQQAFGMNYGVLTCNACKMFFRRFVLLHLDDKCTENDLCYLSIESKRIRPKCRACRFERCLEVGMKYRTVEEEEKVMKREKTSTDQAHPTILVTAVDRLCNLIRSLLHLDSRRYMSFEAMRSDEDPTIGVLISRTARGFTVNSDNTVMHAFNSTADKNEQVLSQWALFGVWTSVEFLNSLDFMSLLNPEDKQIILKSFAMNSYLLASAFQSCCRHCDRLLNPDGTDMYPAKIREMPELSQSFVDRIQKLLVTKLTELKITPEEYILTITILFCTPRLSGMTQYALNIVSKQQEKYCNALMEYCKLTWRHQGPQRFQEIISIGTVMPKCFEDVQCLVQILQLFYPSSYNSKKLLVESLNE